MASNLPPGFEDPADDDDIHEMAEMPFVEEIINDESFMDCLKRVNKSNISSPYDTHDLKFPKNCSIIDIYKGTSATEMFNEFIESISNWKV